MLRYIQMLRYNQILHVNQSIVTVVTNNGYK